ncbi:MAG: hypothetical protein A2808_00670 [Candidatus Moranbacteria bacterium RIFCSPHIGHO2_01_FULL_55_24]|nr:MAG: hypothetical protein A2808_00670 [Candidatus Moranbacteria bacterium RIFCSPHIGHO2_01_FULL_55_24]
MFRNFFASPIICIGSISKDIFLPTDEGVIVHTPEDITSKEKVAFEIGGKISIPDRSEGIGGVAANVSVGLSRLGHRAACYSCVGDDEIGSWARKILSSEGVSTRFLKTLSDTSTDLSAIIVLTGRGDRTIFHNRDANEKLQVREEDLARAEWVFVSSLNGDWKGNVHHILEAKKRYGFRLALNPGQHNIKSDGAFVLSLLKEVSVLMLNKDEAIELLLPSHPHEAGESLEDETILIRKLHAAGVPTLCLTDGRRGAWASDGKQIWQCAVPKRSEPVVDATGAGDAFSSGFFGALLAGKTLDTALRYGMANSQSVISAFSATKGLLSKQAMERAIEKCIPQKIS